MNLLDRKVSISKFTKPGLILLISVFLGCQKADDLGVNYPLGTNVNVKYKEFVLPASNIYIDSLRTDQGNFFLAGSFSDPFTGITEAEGYFQYEFKEGTLPILTQNIYVHGDDSLKFANPTDTLSVDSLILELEIRNTLPDENLALNFELSELVSNLQASVIYLGNNQQSTDKILANFNGKPKQIVDDTTGRMSIRVKFPEETTSNFFQLISDVTRDSTQSLKDYEFKNLALKSMTGNAGLVELLKISNFSNLTLYMDDPDDDSIYTALFPLTGSHYSYLMREKSGTEFDGIIENTDFDLSDGRTFIEPLAGLSISFSINEISDFFEERNSVVINNANFRFEVESSVDRDTLSSFIIFFRKQNKEFFASALTSQQSTFSNVIVSDASFFGSRINPSFSQIKLENDQFSLSLSCTQFMNSVFSEFQKSGSLQFQSPFKETPTPISEFILISPTDLTFQRTIFKKDGIKLRVYYTEIE